MKSWKPLSAGLALTLALPGCARTTAKSAHRDVVRVAEYPYSALAPLYVAADEGYFAAENIDLEFKRVESENPASLAAFLRGELDVATVSPKVSLLNAISRGARARVVAGQGFVELKSCTQFAWVVRSDWVDPRGHFDSARLKGARARFHLEGYSAFETATALAAAGLTLDDLVRAPVPVALAEPALERHDLDFGFLSEIPLAKAMASGRVSVWKKLAEVVPNAQVTAIVFAPRLMGVDREVGIRFLMAYLRGVRALSNGKTPRNIDILSRHLGWTPAELVASCWLSFRADGRIEFATWLDFERWAQAQGSLDRVLPPQAFSNTSILAEANRRLQKSGT